jgi:hypothetical protein
VFGLSRAADHGWTSLQTVRPIAAGIIGLGAFVLIESRAQEPLMPLWVFRERYRSGGYMIQALLAGSTVRLLLPQHPLPADNPRLRSAQAGAPFIPGIGVLLITAGMVSSLVARTGVRPLVTAGTAIAAAGMRMLGQLTPHSSYLTGVELPMMVLCAGLGLTFVAHHALRRLGSREHTPAWSQESRPPPSKWAATGKVAFVTIAATTTRNRAHHGASLHTALATATPTPTKSPPSSFHHDPHRGRPPAPTTHTRATTATRAGGARRRAGVGLTTEHRPVARQRESGSNDSGGVDATRVEVVVTALRSGTRSVRKLFDL